MTEFEKGELVAYLRRIAVKDNRNETEEERGERFLAMDILSQFFGIEI